VVEVNHGKEEGETMFITSDDGQKLEAGDRAYNYYDMKVGTIGPERTWKDLPDVWVEFIHADGSTATLNGQRICSIAHAKRMGWPGV
jgi:hypothetical protein